MNLAAISLAVGAGMLATMNPCGFAMLPSLVSFYLGADDAGYAHRPMLWRIKDGLVFALSVVSGFLVVFSVLGTLVSFGAAGFAQYLPWGTVVVGGGLIVLGLWLFAGKHLLLRVPQMEAPREAHSVRAMALYGMAYAVASLGCTLPIFLVVVGTSLVAGPSRIIVFLAYALGMAIVLLAVALGAVLFQGAVTRYLRGVIPYVQQVGALLLIVAGVFMLVTELPLVTRT
jgi:cytochrome c biogenesis protein CcdA